MRRSRIKIWVTCRGEEFAGHSPGTRNRIPLTPLPSEPSATRFWERSSLGEGEGISLKTTTHSDKRIDG